jgi:hypothetical protein
MPRGARPKWNTKSIRAWIADNKPGYELVGEYIPMTMSKITIRCPNGHVNTLEWSKFQRPNNNCRDCAYNNKRVGIEFIRKSFENEEYTLLTTEYINNSQKLEFVCNNGHHGNIMWTNFKAGKRCRKCKYKLVGKLNKLATDEVAEFFESHGMELIGEYIDSHTPITFICDKGHTWSAEFANIKRAVSNGTNGCEICHRENMTGEKHPRWNGGITPELTALRNTPEARAFRMSILRRDRFTCVVCGSVGKELRVHHLDSFANRIELRFDPDNNITMCASCHDLGRSGSFHSTYGTNNNTREQFNEFISSKTLNK